MSYFIVNFNGYDTDLNDWVTDYLEFPTLVDANVFVSEIVRDNGESLQLLSLDRVDGEMYVPTGAGYGG